MAESPSATAISWIERGRQHYASGRLSEAIDAWNQAVTLSDRQEELLNGILARSYLSLVYQDLGNWRQAEVLLEAAVAAVDPTRDDTRSSSVYAQTFNSLGNFHLHLGRAEAALSSWERAQQWYDRAGDELGRLGVEIDRAQALQALGLYRRSQTVLESANRGLQEQRDSALKAMGLLSLGNALYVLGDRQQARDILQESLAIAQNLETPFDLSPIWLALGNNERADNHFDIAADYYQRAAATTQTPIARIEAQVNTIGLFAQQKKPELAMPRLLSLYEALQELSPSRRGVYARVNFTQSWFELSQQTAELPVSDVAVADLLATAVRQARQLQDPRSEAYALGQLGRLYEKNQQWTEARQLTERALAVAQAVKAADIAARWQWQLGRVLKEQGDYESAVLAYSSAIESLQGLRRDLAAIAPEAQFSFRDSVEPVYRQLVDLLLTPMGPNAEVPQANLVRARETIEALQLAELDNFFREACLDAAPVEIDEIDARAVVVYPIVLPDRLAVILSMPDRDLYYYETRISEAEIDRTLEDWVQYLNPIFPERLRLERAQTLYDWLIRPAQEQLAQQDTTTLVFVLDGMLRNLPMAALHDGDRYLIERYGVALAPSLRLLQSEEVRPSENALALMGGLSESRRGYAALPGVEREIEAIASLLPSQILLNQEFTTMQVRGQVRERPFSILHLATHGQFSSNADETYLVAWDGEIKVKDLDRLLRSRETGNRVPIDLLVLSACQTAAGDKRAALGLAGFAVRSGARSTLATLWSVNDRSTAELMTAFYEQLQLHPERSKAEALRQAQLTLLRSPKYKHPFYWSPFVLVGNWL
ncbi:MAG: CHAT domain-containing protein [Baaleninema sp.]